VFLSITGHLAEEERSQEDNEPHVEERSGS
jgi:hypothetical protein